MHYLIGKTQNHNIFILCHCDGQTTRPSSFSGTGAASDMELATSWKLWLSASVVQNLDLSCFITGCGGLIDLGFSECQNF